MPAGMPGIRSEIIEVLMKSMYRPNKRLGQHFLHDESVLYRMIDVLDIQSDDSILEIGAGEGALTRLLLDSDASQVTAVEIDSRLIPYLQMKFDKDNRFHLVHDDILNLDFNQYFQKENRLRVMGNLPYYLTSPILFHLYDYRSIISDAMVMVQKQVGDRLIANHGNKDYGIPSIFFQLTADIESVADIPREAFEPMPNVESTLLHLTFLREPRFPVADMKHLQKIVKTAFNHRRKMLRNTIISFIPAEIIDSAWNLLLTKRPEQLSVQQWTELSNAIVQHLKATR